MSEEKNQAISVWKKKRVVLNDITESDDKCKTKYDTNSSVKHIQLKRLHSVVKNEEFVKRKEVLQRKWLII